jgi:hypothetical protein
MMGVTKTAFARNSGLAQKEMITLFLLRMMSGVFLGWITIKYYPGNDYWSLNTESMQETQLLKRDPLAFMTSFADNPYNNQWGGFFNAAGSFWNDLRNNIILKILAVMNLLSGGNYFINSIFFNSIGFLGSMALFKTFKSFFPEKKWILIFCSFLIPSTLYFSSGIHKDLIVFSALAFFVYALHLGKENKVQKIITLLLSGFVLLLMRNFLLMILIPMTAGYYISMHTKIRPSIIYTTIFISTLLLSILLHTLQAPIDPIQILLQRHEAFSKLHEASSQMEPLVLDYRLSQLLSQLPLALNHGFLRPFVWEAKNSFSLILALETLFLLILVLIWFFRKNHQELPSLLIMCIALSLIMMLTIGYIVPNSSSVVRYRSLYLPFILAPLLCTLRTSK